MSTRQTSPASAIVALMAVAVLSASRLHSNGSTPIAGAPANASRVEEQSGFGHWRPAPAWDFDGARILGHIGNDVYLWDASTGRVLQVLVGHREAIWSVQFSPDHKHALTSSYNTGGELAIRSNDTSVRLWDLASGKELWKLDGQIARDFSSDGTRLLTCSLSAAGDHCETAMWDTASGRRLFTVAKAPAPSLYDGVHFSQNGRWFFWFWNGMADVYDSNSGQDIGRIGRRQVNAANFYGSDGLMATFGIDGIEVWNPENGQPAQRHPVPDAYGWSACANWTRDGRRIVSARSSWSGPVSFCHVQVWNVNSGEVMTAAGQCGPTNETPIIAADGQHFLLAWGGGSFGDNTRIPGEVGLYDLGTGAQIARISTGGGVPAPVDFSPDGRTFLIGGPTFTVYDAVTGKALFSHDLLGSRPMDR